MITTLDQSTKKRGRKSSGKDISNPKKQEVYIFGKETVCPMCNKCFKSFPEHVYVSKTKKFCSWKCYREK